MEHKELLNAVAPRWDEEHGGVYVPLLNITIQPKNLRTQEGSQNLTWEEAMKLAAESGGRLLTKEEGHLIVWMQDAINAILLKHGGDPLKVYTWLSTEDGKPWAWSISFSSGHWHQQQVLQQRRQSRRGIQLIQNFKGGSF